MASIKFTTKDIFEQDFKIGFRGYDQDEVNDFLDDIMKDYDAYEAIIKELKGEIARLKAQAANSPKQLFLLKNRTMYCVQNVHLQRQTLIFSAV